MEEVREVKKKSKEKESRFGRRYGFEIKLRCVKLHLEEGLPLSLLSKEVGASTDGIRRWVKAYRERGRRSYRIELGRWGGGRSFLVRYARRWEIVVDSSKTILGSRERRGDNTGKMQRRNEENSIHLKVCKYFLKIMERNPWHQLNNSRFLPPQPSTAFSKISLFSMACV